MILRPLFKDLNKTINFDMDFFSLLNSQFSFLAQIFLVTIFGLIFGSLASLLSHRFVTKQSIFFTRSECTKCHAKLKIRNLIPIFSWLFQRGKCSACKAKISIRYPLIEASCAIIFLITYFACNQKIDARMLLLCLISFTLILMVITDLEHYLIPDIIQYLLVVFVIFLRIHDGGTYGALTHLKAAFAYVGFGLLMLAFFYIAAKIEAIGIDDIKFFFIAGLLLGMNNFLLFMLINGILGALFGVIWQRLKNDRTFPFAPAICIALYVCMLFGDKINPVETLGSLIF